MTETAEIRAGSALDQGFLLDGLTVIPQDGSVTGPAGQEQLDPKVMDVLAMLAANAGRVVLREDLLARIWPGAVVTDDALSRCIYELRRQLSQAGGDEQLKALIETVPKRGYRLNGTIAALPAPAGVAAPPAGRGRLWLALATIPIAALLWFGGRALFAPEPIAAYSIAILPFEDMSAAKDQGYLADGIADEIINRLMRIGDLPVIARSSSFAFRGMPVDVNQIASRLKVTHVLEGSVRKAGERIRISAQLVAAADNSLVWSDTFDRELDDLFSVQDEIADSIVSALSIRLRDTTAPPTKPVDHRAYEAFQKGEHLYNRRGPGDIPLAAKYYQEAIAIEPGYVRAWASLAGAYSLMAYEGDIDHATGLRNQGEAARKAIELDPNNALGYARLSQYNWDIGDRKTGYAVWDKALALKQEDPLILNFTAGVAMRAGEIDKAIDAQRRLVALDPLSAANTVNLGMYLLAQDRFEESKAVLREALVLNPDLGVGVDLAILRILVLQKQYGEAERALELLPEGPERNHGLALLAHAQGRKSQADEALARLIADSKRTPDIRLAEVYAFRGMTEAAFAELAMLQKAVDEDAPRMVSQIWSWQVELRVSPFLKPLHSDPRWQPLFHERL
jgi:TolB-like protein/DNA-binding winged helix-turn-helix (wHTH) protein/tetratricopeptide (TPR) repeat protein